MMRTCQLTLKWISNDSEFFVGGLHGGVYELWEKKLIWRDARRDFMDRKFRKFLISAFDRFFPSFARFLPSLGFLPTYLDWLPAVESIVNDWAKNPPCPYTDEKGQASWVNSSLGPDSWKNNYTPTPSLSNMFSTEIPLMEKSGKLV